jgi:hypothetical protein
MLAFIQFSDQHAHTDGIIVALAADKLACLTVHFYSEITKRRSGHVDNFYRRAEETQSEYVLR